MRETEPETYSLVLEEEESCRVIWKVVDRVLRFLGLDDENETEDEQCPEKNCRPVQRRHEDGGKGER